MDAPWSSSKTLSIIDGMDRLNEEIVDFLKYIKPTKQEQLNRDTLLLTVTRLVEMLFPGSSVIPFGSYATGLQFPASDIDVSIQTGSEKTRKQGTKLLYRLRASLYDQDIFDHKNIELVPCAKVPVLTAVDANKVSIDITVQAQNFSSDRTIVWLKEYPELKPLFMVLKQALSRFRLSIDRKFETMSAKSCGLASYSLICLIVSFLQLQGKDYDPKSSDYYARLLLGFLEFYSNFNHEKRVICLTEGGCFYNANYVPKTYKFKNKCLNIIDPDLPDTNVARSSTKIETIREIFRLMLQYLKNRIKSKEYGSILSSIIHVRSHRHGDVREEGANFTSECIYAETRWRKKKEQHKKPTGVIHQVGEPHHIHPKNKDRFKKPYQNNRPRRSDSPERGSSRRKEGYQREYERHQNNRSRRSDSPERGSSRRREGYQREYERHQSNNRSHLAQHYRRKAKQ